MLLTAEFPCFRKLSNGKIYYKILDPTHFEEIQILGKKTIFHQIEAIQYPEKLKIIDLLEMKEDFYLQSSEAEWIKMSDAY